MTDDAVEALACDARELAEASDAETSVSARSFDGTTFITITATED